MDEEAEMPQWLKPLFVVVLLYGLKPVPFKDGCSVWKNISRTSPLNCRSLRSGRDDKGEGGVLRGDWLVGIWNHR